jgi:hypothetical protein
MDTQSARALTSQLADDLGWLEQHACQQADGARASALLRLAAALVRNCVGPLLDGQAPLPLHLAVVGGAGAGKSTVSNLLSGAPAAEANPQAGFTRHPIAYTSTDGPLEWSGHLGFLGPLRRLQESTPSSLDEDVYQVRRVPNDPTRFNLVKDFVVWDCPDMTTWAAASGGPVESEGADHANPTGARPGYVTRLLEAAALGDVIVFVASDERYNDEMPTQFLAALLETGKPVIVCLMKMREADVPVLVAHFQKDVVAHLPAGVVATIPIPFLPPDQLADPARLAGRYRVPLLNQVSALASPSPQAARRRTVNGAVRFLVQNQDRFLGTARQDVDALRGWKSVVDRGREEFDERYRREYLSGEKFRGFDEALVRLMELLELPGVGKYVSGTLYVMRTPYRLLRGIAVKSLSRPESAGRSEQPVLEEAFAGWIDVLRKEATRRSDSHPLWAHVLQGFNSGGLAEQARDRFRQQCRDYQVGLNEEVDRTARAIYEELEKNPAMLNAFRGVKFTFDVAAIAGVLISGGINWHDLILVPLAASLTHQLVEVFGKQYVDTQRELARQRQGALLKQRLSGPLAEYLTRWPATGGSAFERLQLALQRVPGAIGQLASAVQTALARMPAAPALAGIGAVASPAIPLPGHRS